MVVLLRIRAACFLWPFVSFLPWGVGVEGVWGSDHGTSLAGHCFPLSSAHPIACNTALLSGRACALLRMPLFCAILGQKQPVLQK